MYHKWGSQGWSHGHRWQGCVKVQLAPGWSQSSLAFDFKGQLEVLTTLVYRLFFLLSLSRSSYSERGRSNLMRQRNSSDCCCTQPNSKSLAQKTSNYWCLQWNTGSQQNYSNKFLNFTIYCQYWVWTCC